MRRHRQNDVYSSAVLGFAKPWDEDLHQQRVKENADRSQGQSLKPERAEDKMWIWELSFSSLKILEKYKRIFQLMQIL